MKRINSLLIVLLGMTYAAIAQLPENLTRNVLAVVEQYGEVKTGEFQIELLKGSKFNDATDVPWFSYVYCFTNKFTQESNIIANGQLKVVNRSVNVRPYKVGPTMDKSIFVVKNIGASEKDMGTSMEIVFANGIIHPVCDSVLYLNDDGYVCSVDGICYYIKYRDHFDNVTKPEPVVWPSRKIYDQQKKGLDEDKLAAFSKLGKGDVYHESPEGHYYYIFKDQYMPNTVLVVDNKVYELFGVYNEDDFKFKFSYNGQHWMALGRNCYWIDGTIKSVEGFTITDFLVSNDGHCAYKAYKNDSPDKREFVVVDGRVVRRNARVCYFALDAKGGFKFRFVTDTGHFLQYENEVVTDVTEDLTSVCYPNDGLGDLLVTVASDDGKHKLTYKRNAPSIEVDGMKLAESTPCFAVFDSRNKAFVWNAVEERNGSVELVIYRYAIVNKFFKF